MLAWRRFDHRWALRWWATVGGLCAALVFAFGFSSAWAQEKPLLRVVSDDNYPPYIFRDSEGRLQGILVDQWALWEKHTGRPVELTATDWAKAQELFREGHADVIDTIFLTPERAALYSFSAPYAEIPVSIFYHETISGIPDPPALKGFAVAVKDGDACIEVLKRHGTSTFLFYASYEAIVRDAASAKVKIFCIDDPPAFYLMTKYGVLEHFKKGFTLYSGQFHRAVLKGREDVLRMVEDGFALLPKESLREIDRKWLGSPLGATVPWRVVGWVVGALCLVAFLSLLWNVLLNARVRRKTQEAERLLAETREREELLRTTFSSMAEGVITTDAQGSVRHMNPLAEKLTGWSETDAQGRPIGDVFRIVNEKTRRPLDNPVDLVLRRGMTVGLANDTLLISRDGTEYPIADSAAPIRDTHGRLVGCVLVFRDQTEERRTLSVLHETLEKYQLTLEAASMSSWDWHVEERRVVRDALWAVRRGLRPEEPWEDPNAWQETVHPEDRRRVLSRLRDHLEGRSPHFEATYRIQTRDGSWMWIWDRGKVIARDASGKPRRVIGIEVDITAQKTMETRLRLLTRVVEQSPLCVVITDPTGKIEYVNPRFCDLTGYEIREVIGENPRILQSGMTPRETYDALWRTITRGQVWKGVFCNRKKDGSLYWEEAVICPIVDDTGRISHYVGLKEDITAKRQLEDQLARAQKLESVGRLAGGVAHDFNNALQIIMGYAEVALGLVNSQDRLHRMLNEIHKAAQRSAGVVRQLLTFARKEVIRPVALNLNDHLEETHRMLQRLIGEEIVLELRPGEELWPVLLDPSQTDQMVANLVINARDAIERTGKITIETENVIMDGSRKAGPVFIPKGEYVRLSVADTGCGMDAETLARIFEPFFTTKEVGKGTGLGLSTVYGIVKQNRGWIDVTSTPGQGSRFDLFFPRHFVESDERAHEPWGADQEDVQGAGETILLVEDEPTILDLARSILESSGFRVVSFQHPEEAVRWAEEHPGPLHLVITDVVMPAMSGREVWDRVKKTHPQVPCLFMSGYTADILIHRGVGAAETHFIHKPFTADALLWKIREVIFSKHSRTVSPSRNV